MGSAGVELERKQIIRTIVVIRDSGRLMRLRKLMNERRNNLLRKSPTGLNIEVLLSLRRLLVKAPHILKD